MRIQLIKTVWNQPDDKCQVCNHQDSCYVCGGNWHAHQSSTADMSVDTVQNHYYSQYQSITTSLLVKNNINTSVNF